MKSAAATVLTLVTMSFAQVGRCESPSEQDLIPKLKDGGYVLFLRHPQTNPDQADTDPFHLENTNAQRQLTDEGRSQAKAIGEAFRALKIPVAGVTTSKFFRAYETGKLMGVAEVTTSIDVTEGGQVVTPKENQRRAKALRTLLGTPPLEGQNSLIVSHKPNLQDAAGKEFGDLAEGEIAVFKPRGGHQFELVARVAPPSKWTEWAKSASK
jgi:phosphohistidine phosphatase SixA